MPDAFGRGGLGLTGGGLGLAGEDRGGTAVQRGGSLIGPTVDSGAASGGREPPVGSLAAAGSGSGGQAGPEGMRSLGFGTPALPLGARLAVEMVATTGTVTLCMAFFVFGKRRRDGEQPATDDVLKANASSLMSITTAALIPALADAMTPMAAPSMPGGALSPDELAMPRWRRPSLLQARKADPLRSATSQVSLTFERGAVDLVAGHERRVLRYRLVRLLDQPDELRGNEIGFLDEGDEVQVLTRAGAYCLVLCPDGGRGWIHKMTLGDIVGEQVPPVSIDEVRRSFGGRPAASVAAPVDDDAGSAALGGFAGSGGAGGVGGSGSFGGRSPSRAGQGNVLGGAAAGAGGFGPTGFAEAPARAEPPHDDADALDEDVITAFLSARRAV